MKITYTFIMKVLPALLAALCWTSCSDFLEEDPKGQLPSDTYFSNKEDLDASLTALYSVIASSQASNNLCGTNFWWETIFPLILQVISSLSVSMISLM